MEERNFRFADMHSDLSMSAGQSFVWLDTGKVPDLTLAEARRWYIYRVGRYFDAGYEAIHLGQIHLVGARDIGFEYIADLIQRIRRLAKLRARRGEVILDAHSHGIVRNGQLLLDFISRPSPAKRASSTATKTFVCSGRGGLAAGWHAGGWYAEEHPNLVEIDNWGGRSFPEENWDDIAGRQAQGRWGWDDVSWFAHQDPERRKHFLRYVYRQCRLASPMNFFQFPACRTLGNTPLYDRGPTATHYRANPANEDCPCGWDDARHMTELWAGDDPQDHQLQHNGNEDPIGIPLPVMILGTIQEEFGGIANDPMPLQPPASVG